MIHTPSSKSLFVRVLCAVFGHWLSGRNSQNEPVKVRFYERWFYPGVAGALVGCRTCGAVWNDLIEAKVPMRAIGKCKKCFKEIFKATKDSRIFASCECRVGYVKYSKLKPIVNGRIE